MVKTRLILVLSIMAGLIVGGFFLIGKGEAEGKSSTDRQPTAYIEGNESKVSFKLAGRIEELLVDEGDIVTKGQVIGILQNDELEAKVSQAEAALGVADGQISQAKAAQSTAEAKKEQGKAAVNVTAETAEKQVAQAEAAIKAAEAKLTALKNGARPEEIKQAESQMKAAEEIQKVAKVNLERLQSLLEQGLISQAEVDKANTSYQEANGKYEVAKQQYELAVQGPREEEVQAAEAQVEQAKAAYELAVASQAEVSVRQSEVKAAEAGIEQAAGAVSTAASGKSQAEAALAEANVYLSYTQLIAPADGIIKAKAAEVGELVNAGFPVFTLEQEKERWSKFYFPETEISDIQVGDTVQLSLSATGKRIKGEVVSISPSADFAVQKATQNMDDTDIRSFSVKVKYTSLPKDVKTGMTVKWLGVSGEQNGK
ncbi:HlyD family secretion protein [Niallia endozanthoxylica]|uniref:HlyD family efflux transporter periplasmic adaptor subunit n=1 Tax=Niallia endozanthoxylica TaxID=2036016 RepID=A0A5J5H5I0_9BACI|nr:HlyD family efflux transporter periplasmic adaptor subunit [Niallia endozanthoxylica]KAA9015517.1 HlyD family efflux transporter periplasmic adaptor subunit [Niallia endozanthoxylica]